MITLKDLQNRVYRDKMCTSFEYNLVDKDREENDPRRDCFVARFSKGREENEWNMCIVLERTRDADSQVYNFGYVMPKAGLPLELIAATGLKFFQLYLKGEVQTKIDYDFVLGEVLKGM